MERHTYASAGVNIKRAEAFVDRLKNASQRPLHKRLWKASGGYAAVIPVTDDLAVALTTDGVGTKLLLASEAAELETIGIDLVAMCANDLICVGATPTAFLDYYATGQLLEADADAIIAGIIAGCDQARMPLVGGETAELPGLYAEKHFDIAGFAMGTVTADRLIRPDSILAGDAIVGVASSGIHSNGLSLARKLVAPDSPLRQELLKPTLIYVPPVLELFDKQPGCAKGLVHITGSGWRNLFRLHPTIGFQISQPLPLPPIFQELGKQLEAKEMYKTFNMGMGLAIITAAPQAVIEVFVKYGFTAAVVGLVTDQAATVSICSEPHGLGVPRVTLES